MTRILSLIALAVGVAAASSATAAEAAQKPGDVPQQMARCLYERYTPRAEALLRSTSTRAAENAYVVLLDEPICSKRLLGNRDYGPDDLLGSIHLMRGMLAEQALTHARPAARALAALPVHKEGYARPWTIASGRNHDVDEMAVCVADTNPSGILALFGAAPSTVAETAAMRKLDSSIRRCLSAALKLAVPTRSVRGALADALYQRVSNPALSLAQAEIAK